MGSEGCVFGASPPTDDGSTLVSSNSSSSIINRSVDISDSSSNISQGSGSDSEVSTGVVNNSIIHQGPGNPHYKDDGIGTVGAEPTPKEAEEEIPHPS